MYLQKLVYTYTSDIAALKRKQHKCLFVCCVFSNYKKSRNKRGGLVHTCSCPNGRKQKKKLLACNTKHKNKIIELDNKTIIDSCLSHL